jgi:hypothetical protein
MNSVDNLKSTQLRKLFKICNSISMQCLNIFEGWEAFLFEFTNLSGVWKFERIFLLGQAHLLAACSHWSRSPLWAGPLSLHPNVTTGGHHPFRSPSHRSTAAPCCSALHRPPLCLPSPATDEPPLSCPTGPKEVPCHRAPPAPRTCPRC